MVEDLPDQNRTYPGVQIRITHLQKGRPAPLKETAGLCVHPQPDLSIQADYSSSFFQSDPIIHF